MVKVKDEPAMAEPKPATTSQQTTNNNNTYTRKPRNNNGHSHHFHPPFYHFPYYHHCSYPSEGAEAGAANGAPAKFYFGPGFEPQTHGSGGRFGAGPSQAQNNEYVVFFHVNPGVTISFQIGDNMEVLRGPVTVPMVSTNSSPPIAMPVQVPHGHVVQQIVDENGTLRHVILSPQHPAGLVPLASHNPQHYGAGPANGTNQNPQPFYQGLPPGYHPPPHFHSSVPPGHPPHIPSPTHPGHSPPPSHGYYKDERAQRQYVKLKRKLHDKQQKTEGASPRKELVNGLRRGAVKEKGMNSVGTSEDGEEGSSVQDEEDSVQIITDMLSSVQPPKVSELSSRSALLQWAPPSLRLSEASANDAHELDISESDLRYEVLLSDKSKEMKFKSIYSGTSLSCRIQDLRPGQEYSVCLQVHLDELQGSASDPVRFTTPPCEPDQPQAPKLISRTKSSLQLRWNAVNDNGAHIQHYVLEYDDGKGGDFVELHKIKSKQYTLQKLLPATVYRFRLAALNEMGKSPYSDVVTFSTSDNPPSQPQPPFLKEATVNSLHLQWQRTPKDDEYTLQMNDPKSAYGYMVVYNGRDTHYVCVNLNHYSEYKFRLRAQNEGGCSPWSDEVLFRTLPDRPARPSKPLVKGRIHAHSFRLKWEPPALTGGAEITGYQLELNSGGGYETAYAGPDTEAACDRLAPGTTYQLRVCCFGAGGRSDHSDPCTVTTDAVAPGRCGTPRPHGAPRAGAVSVRWSEPDHNGGAPVLEYEVEMVSPDSGRSLVHKGKEMECCAANLVPGSEYSFQVRAVNRIGPGPWSEYLTVMSGAAAPDRPEAPVATAKSPFHVYVEWMEPKSNGAQITEYRLEMSQTDSDDLFSPIFQGLSTSHDVKGLSPFTAYHYRVQAFNAAGASPFSAITTTVTPPAAPSAVTVTRCETTPTTITIYWTEPACNGAEIARYVIEIGDRTEIVDAPATEHTIRSLTPDTPYRLKIQAVNAVGAGALSSTAKAQTPRLPPAAPRLECIAAAHNHLKLRWGEGKNADYTQYCVEMENRRTQEYQCVFKGTAFTCKVNKLQELTAYKFRVRASNDAGDGDWSEEHEFRTGYAPPAGVKAPHAAEVEQRGCVLEWTPSRNSTGDPVVYVVQVCRLKDQIYKQVYKGPETRCHVENLEPAAEYNAKVCPVRLTSAGELSGPFSPLAHFTTAAPEPAAVQKSVAAVSSSPAHGHRASSLLHSFWSHVKNPKSISDQQWVFIIAVFIAIVGIVISVIIMRCINPK